MRTLFGGGAIRAPARAISLGVSTLLILAAPASAASTLRLTDVVGDSADISGPRSTPAYLDIVSVSVGKHGGRFEFSTTVAAAVPDRPVLPSGVKEAWWFWPLDTDPTTFPFGFPRGPGLAFPPELLLAVTWNGQAFRAFVVDRRPTLMGGEHITTPVPFQIRDATVTSFLDASIAGDPARFGTLGYTRVWFGPPGTEGFEFTDVTGTPGVFATWPA
jgi:hypothetical protein